MHIKLIICSRYELRRFKMNQLMFVQHFENVMSYVSAKCCVFLGAVNCLL